jgi:hypothetical protein
MAMARAAGVGATAAPRIIPVPATPRRAPNRPPMVRAQAAEFSKRSTTATVAAGGAPVCTMARSASASRSARWADGAVTAVRTRAIAASGMAAVGR